MHAMRSVESTCQSLKSSLSGVGGEALWLLRREPAEHVCSNQQPIIHRHFNGSKINGAEVMHARGSLVWPARSAESHALTHLHEHSLRCLVSWMKDRGWKCWTQSHLNQSFLSTCTTYGEKPRA